MPYEVQIVLLLIALAMLAMLVYVRIVLPARMRRDYRQSLEAFSAAVELRFPRYQGTTHRVVDAALKIGRQMLLSTTAMERLEMAAYLRDIGLTAIPYQLVNAKLASEWDQGDIDTFDRHPEVSGAMLELVPSLRHLAPIVRHHHTRYDVGMRESLHVPLEARILVVACDWAFRAQRFGEAEAAEAIRDESGARFDPDVVQAALRVLPFERVDPVERAVLVS